MIERIYDGDLHTSIPRESPEDTSFAKVLNSTVVTGSLISMSGTPEHKAVTAVSHQRW